MKMDYNTQREKLILPEYGRMVQQMIERVKEIPDKAKRSEQIQAVIQVMGQVNPQVKDMVDYRRKLWDHMYMIAGYDIDVDSPYPLPDRKTVEQRPSPIPLEKAPIKATCYGRNIERMIELIASRPDDDAKTEMIRMLALYMRQQYLIWNKDSVADETIFADMERLSAGRLTVPAGIRLAPVSSDTSFARPGIHKIENGQQGGFKKNKKNKRKRN